MTTMRKVITKGLLLSLLLLPAVSLAHETRMYEINGVPYEIVVGSLNEPVVVDDKTGVSIEIVRNGAFLAGAQESLQVEMIAGDAKKVVNLSPVYGAEGQYKSNFIATVPTTLTYRFFGTLEGSPVDLSFSCNPAGHPQAEEDVTRSEVSEGVIQTLKRGAFGCPLPKDELGFPETVDSSFALAQEVETLQESVKEHSGNNWPLIVALGALLISGVSLSRTLKK